METKRYIRSESASCVHMVEDSTNSRIVSDPHEKLRALLNAPDDDTDELAPPSDAPKFGTVIHNRIFVGGFSLTTTDEDLWKFFSGFTSVTAARVIYDRAGVSKCYGFVTFSSPRHARLIVKQSGGVMFSPLGRLRVAQAVRKQISQLAMLSPDCAPLAPVPASLCYQMMCPSPYGAFACGPCAPAPAPPPPPYAIYPMPFEGSPMFATPQGPYTLVPAGYNPLSGAPCCEPCCSVINQDKAHSAMPLHPAYIY